MIKRFLFKVHVEFLWKSEKVEKEQMAKVKAESKRVRIRIASL